MVEMERCKNCNNIREDGSFCPFCGYAHDTTVGQPPVQSINSAAQVTYQNSTQPQAFYENPMPP